MTTNNHDLVFSNLPEVRSWSICYHTLSLKTLNLGVTGATLISVSISSPAAVAGIFFAAADEGLELTAPTLEETTAPTLEVAAATAPLANPLMPAEKPFTGAVDEAEAAVGGGLGCEGGADETAA